MTSHERALGIAGAAPAFRPDPPEDRELRDHLRACPDCARAVARMRADLDAIGRADPAVSPRLHDLIREIAVTQPRTGPNVIGIILAFVLLSVAAVGVSAGVGALQGTRPANTTPDVAPRDGDVVWRTDTVTLAASSITIQANGLTFVGPGAADLSSSDLGNLTSWTLEATWFQHAREQRLHLYFTADAQSWWITQVRAYDGDAKEPDWAMVNANPWPDSLAMGRLGQVYEGDWAFDDVPSATGPVDIRIADVRIAVRPRDTVTEPFGGQRIVLQENANPAVNGNPFDVGGPLRCSGILALPPQAAEVRLLALGYALSWRWVTSTGSNTGFSELRTSAPDRGWITNTAVGSDGELIVFVANPDNPDGPKQDLAPECSPATPSP